MKNKSSVLIGLKLAAGFYIIYLTYINQGEINLIVSFAAYFFGALLILGAFKSLNKLNKQNKK